MMGFAQGIHHQFGVSPLQFELLFQFGRERRPVGWRQQCSGIEQFIQQDRMACQIAGSPFAGIEHAYQPLCRCRKFSQKR